VKKGCGSYLTIHNSFRKGLVVYSSFSVQFLPFLTCYPAGPLSSSFSLVFGFSLLYLAHVSLNSQGRLHAGWLCSVFFLEKEWCCNNGCSRSWDEVWALSSSKLCYFSFSCLRRQLQLGLGFNFCWERKRKKGKRSVGHAAIIDRSLRRGRVTFSLPLVCIPSLKEVGCFGVDLNLFFLPLLVIPRPVFPFLLTP
jgi:hypothetical protein